MVGTVPALGALAYKDKWADIRLISDFATSGSGTVTDPYIDGIQEALDDAYDAGVYSLVALLNGCVELTDTVQMDYANRGVGVIGVGYSGAKIVAPANKTMFEIGKTVWTKIPRLWNLQLEGQNCGTEPAILVHGKGTAGQMFNTKITANNAIKLLADNGYNSWLHIDNSEIYGHASINGGILIDVPLSANRFNKLIVRNTLFKTSAYDKLQIGIQVGDYAIAEDLIIQNCIIQHFSNTSFLKFLKRPPAEGCFSCPRLEIIPSLPVDSRFIQYDGCDEMRNIHFLIHSNYASGSASSLHYFVWIGQNLNGIHIYNNDLSKVNWQTKPIHVEAGSNVNGMIKGNVGVNPFGVLATPIDNTNHLIHINGGAANPTMASQDYAVTMTKCRVISTGGTAVSITVKDKGGNIIESGLANYDGWLEPEWTINFGAFSAAPTVKVVFG
jgi:hypothetical protein